MTQANLDVEHQLVDATEHADEPVKIAGKSPMQLAVMRFRKDKLSMVALVIVVLFFLAAVAAPILVQTGVLDPYQTRTSADPPVLDANTLPIGTLGGISWDHPLGIEPGSGRDMLARLWYGITYSLLISISATLLAVTFGVVMGIVSGAAGGWVDAIIGRIIDLTLAFPQTLMLLALAAVGLAFIVEVLHIPSGPRAEGFYVIAVLAIFGWTSTARLVRGQVLSLREREFVHAATLLGASKARIYFKEILPNLWAPILVTFTLLMPAFVSAEAALSYLGVSIKPPTPTLGNILQESVSYAGLSEAFMFFGAPAFLIATIVVSFNLLGDGLRDALDPKGKQ